MLSNAKRDEYREMAHALIKELGYCANVFNRDIEVLAELLDDLAYRGTR